MRSEPKAGQGLRDRLPSPARVPGPVRGTESHTIHSDDGRGASALVAMDERLRRTEAQLAVRNAAAAGSVGSATPVPGALAAVMEKQVELLGKKKVLNCPASERRTNSTAKVGPKAYWPHLGDDGPGRKRGRRVFAIKKRTFAAWPITVRACRTGA